MPHHENRRVSGHCTNDVGKHVQEYDGLKDVQHLGAGDSYYVRKFLKPRDLDRLYAGVLEEAPFIQMFHFENDGTEVSPIPRMVAAQTSTGEQTPIYRMPGCNERNIPTTEWTESVQEIIQQASEHVGQEFNHAVLTLFRNEDDSLAFHHDKLLDLEDDTVILSISLGAPRPILFHEDSGKTRQKLLLQPGSLLAIGPRTNKSFMHAIPKLTNPTGPRISLSIRSIASYKTDDQIVGKGEEHQTANYPHIKSYCDTEGYTDEIKARIADIQAAAQTELETIRASAHRTSRAMLA